MKMSFFRVGRVFFRSFIRSLEVFKEAPRKTVVNTPFQLSHQGKAVQGDCSQLVSVPHSISAKLCLSSFTRAVFQGFTYGKSNLVTSYGSVFKGQANFRLMRKGVVQGPLFSFLGFVCAEFTTKSSACKEEEEDFQRLHQWIQQGLQSLQKDVGQNHQKHGNHRGLKLADYSITDRLGRQSSNSAVYEATRNDEKLAVKMLFNFSTRSNSKDLTKKFAKEKEVLHVTTLTDATLQDEDSRYINVSPHHNILPVLHSFVDSMPCLPDAKDSYPAALPAQYQGFGRNKTMFFVMPRLDCTVQEYLTTNLPDTKTSTLLLMQLLDGITHLVTHGIAHRDLKTDNLLLDTSKVGCPRLLLCDFGCCLAEKNVGLQLPFLTEETDRGGNAMLMAPEVITAQCGDGVTIDYSKSDAWAAGAIAYQLFGERNPFCSGGLDSSSYAEEDLPALTSASCAVRWVVNKLLRRNQRHRLSARDALTILHVLLFAPAWWLRDQFLVTQGHVLRWLVQSSTNNAARKTTQFDESVEEMLKFTFLCRTSVDEVVEAVATLRAIQTDQKQ